MTTSPVPKLQTGIAGLDNMLFGGVPIGNQVLVAGGPGAGKTLLCFEILYRNAKAGTPCLFVALEDKSEDIIANVKSAFTELGDLDDLMSKNMLKIDSEQLPFEMIGTKEKEEIIGSFGKLISNIEDSVKAMNAKCVVIDSLSLLKLVSAEGDSLTYRRALLGLMASLRRLGVTAFLTMELDSGERKEMKFSQEFFIFDGILVLYQSENNERRTLNLEIIKMRRTNHSLSFAPYEFTVRGFRIFAVEQADMY